MAEYYAVLKKAVGGASFGSAESRRAVYDKARNALIGQLKAIDPPLPASEISRQRLELEEAIRRIERETVAEAQSANRQRQAIAEAAPSPSPDHVREAAAPVQQEPAPAAARDEVKPSAQDIFRRAIQDAEARGSAAAHSGDQPPTRPQSRQQSEESVVEPPPNWPQAASAKPSPQTHQRELEAQYTPPRQVEMSSPAPVVNARDETYETQREVPRDTRRRRSAPVEAFDDEMSDEPKRRSRLPTILLVVLIIGMIGGLAALAWSQRTVIADLIAGFDSGPAEVVTPVAVPEVPASAESKSADRLGEVPASDPSVRVVGDPEASGVPAPPQAAPDPIAEAIVDAPPLPAAGADALAGQKAVLYEEPLDATTAAAGVTAFDAAVSWQLDESGASGPEIVAAISIPERNMSVRMVIKRNIDAALPASHLVETIVTTPADFPGRGIRSVPRIVFKLSEDERGEPLVGAAAKVADGFFWIALSAAPADVAKNLQLLKQRPWIDLPLVYESGQRAILTFEKGDAGTSVFDRALAAWNAG